jgi:DNA repair protein RecN (Recombination protein N)
VETALREVEDVAAGLRDYADKTVFDPERLAEVDARLEMLHKLTRKYGPGIEDVRAALTSAEEKLALLEGHDERLAAIEKASARAEEEGRALSRELSAARRRAARGLERKVREELAVLGMPQAAFEAHFADEALPPPGFTERGADRVEFLFSPNPGEPPRPLSRVASGGELARTMLALQNVLAAGDLPTTFVFDEADAGVGGRLADAVGRRLADLASPHQVLCITHLPQIAARGAWHLRVIKEQRHGRTVARVEPLEGEARVEEIARMSGGARVSETTRAHARDLLSRGARDAMPARGASAPPAPQDAAGGSAGGLAPVRGRQGGARPV